MKIRKEKQVLRHGFKQVLFSNYSSFKIGMGFKNKTKTTENIQSDRVYFVYN